MINCKGVGRDLRQECHLRGIIDLEKSVRGLGCWSGDDGGLVVHLGDEIWSSAGRMPPGEYGGYYYPAMMPLPKPSTRSMKGGEFGPGHAVHQLFQKWNWPREIDALLATGLIGSAFLGGALYWRPHSFTTGDRGTGKSTYLEVISHLFDEGVIESSDATSAGLHQMLRCCSLPVLLDEQESEAEGSKMTNVLKLARQASSGGRVLRGGSDHNASTFSVRSSFLMAGINVPTMPDQDLSRFTIMELEPLGKDARADFPSVSELKKLGAAFKRRLIDGWPRLKEVLLVCKEALRRQGHDARSADQFGTLLACAHIAMEDGPINEEILAALCAELDPKLLFETSEQVSNGRRCLNHLLETFIDPHRGRERKTIRDWIGQQVEDWQPGGDGGKETNAFLARYGLRVFAPYEDIHNENRQLICPRGSKWLAVANSNRNLQILYADSDWTVRKGGGTAPWRGALRRLPGAALHKLHINGSTRCVLIPLETIFEDGEMPGLADPKN